MKKSRIDIPRFQYYHDTENSLEPFNDETLSGIVSTHSPFSQASGIKQITYREYMDFIRNFLASRWDDLISVLERRLNENIVLLSEISISAEKKGGDYHPASIRFVANGKKVSLVANVALTSRGRSRLIQDFNLLRHFFETGHGMFLPEPFLASTTEEQSAAELNDSMILFIAEWLEDFHEFHLTRQKDQGDVSVIIWNMDTGLRLLSIDESRDIYRRVAFILTSYFNLTDYREIFPWHHAAGDFVVRIGADMDVKLVTVRQYVPRIQSEMDFELNLHEATLLFLCNLSLRNRIDRLDGVGDMTWAPVSILHATVQGILESLETRQVTGETGEGFYDSFLSICRKLDLIAWTQLFDGTLASYNSEAPDFAVIEDNLPEHILEVYQFFQGH